MCMFSLPTLLVSNTKILQTRLLDRVHRQPFIFATYANNVDMNPLKHAKNAMVFPLPCAKDKLTVFDSTDKWVEVVHAEMAKAFDDLKIQQARASSFGFGSKSMGAPSPPLAVYKAGSYIYSIASDLQELSTYNRNSFQLSRDILASLDTNYNPPQEGKPPRCFLLLQFDAMAHGTYHPFMYLYPHYQAPLTPAALEDELDGKCDYRYRPEEWIVPTRHFHPRDSSAPAPHAHGFTLFGVRQQEEKDQAWSRDWDHDIIFCGLRPDEFYRAAVSTHPREDDVTFTNGSTFMDILVQDPTTKWYNFRGRQDENLTFFPDKVKCMLWMETVASHVNDYMVLKNHAIRFQPDDERWCVARLQLKGRYPNGDINLLACHSRRFYSKPISTHFVRCDQCHEEPIQGARFMCTTCPNYDLCGSCFVKELCPEPGRPCGNNMTSIEQQHSALTCTMVPVRTHVQLQVALNARAQTIQRLHSVTSSSQNQQQATQAFSFRAAPTPTSSRFTF